MGKTFYQPWRQNLGRNGWDQPTSIPDDMSAESLNIELREGGLGKKRQGHETVILGGTAAAATTVRNLAVFVPGNDATAQELWFCADNATTRLFRLPGDVNSSVELASSLTLPLRFAQLNGKFFIAMDSAANRLYVYAPAESTTTIRLAGLKPEAPPTITDQGGGTYPAVPRSYRTIVKRIVSGVVVSQSEPSTSVAFTPSGINGAARVTKGAATGEGETHWCVEAASANGIWWQISGDIVVATTTYDDSVEPKNYPATGTVPPPLGSNYPFPSVKYLISDGVRLLGLGAYETSQGDSVPPVNGRLYFTPAIGSSDMGDDERIVDTTATSGWIDLNVGGGGSDRGIGLINNGVAAFQTNGTFIFATTGNAEAPYRRILTDTSIGCISGDSIVIAEDESGQPALYFLDPLNGPYRITNGYIVQWVGKDIKDIWNTVDQSATEASFKGCYDANRKIIVWKIASSSSFNPYIVYDVTNGRVTSGNEVRKGWVRWLIGDTVAAASFTGGVMFSTDLLSSHPITKAMYLGHQANVSSRFIRSKSTATTDAGLLFQAYVRSRAYWWGPMGTLKKLMEAIVTAKTRAATTIRALFIPNWGSQTGATQTISLAPVGSEAYVRPRPSPINTSEVDTMQMELGDSTLIDNTWEIDGAEMKLEETDKR